MTEITLRILDMECAVCVSRLGKIILRLEGVASAQVNFSASSAVITYDEEKTDISLIAAHIKKAGFRVPVEEQDLIPCNYEEITEKLTVRLRELPAVKDISVDEDGAITVLLWPVGADAAELIRVCSECGYAVTAGEHRGGDEEQELSKRLDLLRTLIESAAATSMLMLELHPKLQFAIGTALQHRVGKVFYKGALRDIRNKSFGMDTLISLSSSLIYLYSSHTALTRKSNFTLYFGADGVLLTLILFGKYIEQMATGEVNSAIRRLLQLQPKTATVLEGDSFVEKAVESIVPNDTVLVRAGERIPADGVITDGSCAIDESMLTGESMPVDKTVGDSVVGGSLCRTGVIKISAQGLGKQSVLQQIVAAVRKAQCEKAPIQKFADSVAGWFVPAVIGAAAVSFLLWYKMLRPRNLEKALLTCCDVLSVACPCALGLATPTALMVASGTAAEYGMLFSSGRYIENAHKTDTVVFDKTGTLTKGKPEVRSVAVYNGMSEDELLRLCASLEALSEHPIAKAVTEYAKDKLPSFVPYDVTDFETHFGLGVIGEIDRKVVLCGNRKLMEKYGVDISLLPQTESTELCVSYGGTLVGMLRIADSLKPEACEVIQRLNESGKDIFIVTGDNESTANAIAAELGIDNVIANVLPTEKEEILHRLKAEGRTICMVGDGINDTPALAYADCSVAMGNGSDIAIESAGILLPSGNLEKLPEVFEISKQTMKVVNQNLKWALFYNAISIPVAAAGVLHPSICAMSMSLSSIGVLMNSLRLQGFGKKERDKAWKRKRLKPM